MGSGNEAGFERGRRQVYALFQHAVEEEFEALDMAGYGLLVARDFRLFCKEDAEHTPDDIGAEGYFCAACDFHQSIR